MRLGILLRLIVGACICVYLTGCASPLREATKQFRRGAYPEALETLEKKSGNVANRDQLLLHLNKGMVLHQLGRFEQSTKELLAASDIIEVLSRASFSEQISTLAINDWVAAYRGEYAEQLWVHTYLMMNFLLLNNAEGAAVEARRALKVFAEQPSSLEQALFTRALMATSFESSGLINDAYLEYKQLEKASGDNSSVIDKLYTQALQLGFENDRQRYRKDLLDTQHSLLKANVPQGELIIFLSQGDIPFKVAGNVYFPPDIRLSWPEYRSSYRALDRVDVYNDKGRLHYQEVQSDFASLARTSLYDRGKRIAAKQALRAGTKHFLADEVGDENALAGGLLKLAFFVLEEADTRAWDSLPSHMSMLRIPLDPGSHTIRLSARGHELYAFPTFSIRDGQRVFRHFRLETVLDKPLTTREPRTSPLSVEYGIEREL